MSDTIFTKIINREIPAHIVYEDDVVLAFLDIAPINHGHTLIVPKNPFVNLFDGDSEVLAQMMRVGQKIATALKASGLAEGANLIMNNGEAAGQEVFHAHLHVVPRNLNDQSFLKPNHVPNPKEQFSDVQKKIQTALSAQVNSLNNRVQE
ncbi:MAG TPA: HIT family protein [Candidatus Paceibacterota bacterium]|nr:HIT family protein [Candidatus Paceibacterota bacterium]